MNGELCNGDVRCVIDTGGEVRICGTLVWGYERGGSYVSFSYLRLVEAGPRASRFVGASYILSPWSINCVN